MAHLTTVTAFHFARVWKWLRLRLLKKLPCGCRRAQMICFRAVGAYGRARCSIALRANALEILKRDPAAEFSRPNPNWRRPAQLDERGVSVPASAERVWGHCHVHWLQ
jgi:hypothetical protein